MKAFVRFTPILPEYLWDVSGVPLAVYRQQFVQGQIVRRMYRRTVRTWRDKPHFTIKVRKKRMRYGRGYELTINYDRRTRGGKHYYWTDWGTPRHPITARRVPRLKFRTRFRPKTRVRVIGSSRGSTGGSWVAPKAVMHPGTTARMFTAEIFERRRVPLQNAMVNAINRATKRKKYRG